MKKIVISEDLFEYTTIFNHRDSTLSFYKKLRTNINGVYKFEWWGSDGARICYDYLNGYLITYNLKSGRATSAMWFENIEAATIWHNKAKKNKLYFNVSGIEPSYSTISQENSSAQEIRTILSDVVEKFGINNRIKLKIASIVN